MSQFLRTFPYCASSTTRSIIEILSSDVASLFTNVQGKATWSYVHIRFNVADLRIQRLYHSGLV